MKKIKRFLDWIALALTGKGAVADDAVCEGLLDYSGQGRNKYGK